MRFVDIIAERLWSIGEWFWDAYNEVKGWVWPFHLLADPLYQIQRYFGKLTYDVKNFGEWLDVALSQVGNILTWESILNFILNQFPRLEDTIDWFWGRWYWFQQEVTEWWDAKKQDVEGWIDIATQGFDKLAIAWDTFRTITFPQWTDELAFLKANWGNFWTVTMPTLVSFSWLTTWWLARLSDVEALINTAFVDFTPFWEGWQDVRDGVIKFINDPWGCLYDRFDDFIERFW